MTETKPRGRPRSDNPMGKIRGIRFTAQEDELIAQAASLAGTNVAAWIREKAVAAAKRALR